MVGGFRSPTLLDFLLLALALGDVIANRHTLAGSH